MTIRHLKIFIAVVDLGKMSIAAKELHISQPTISQAVSEIENYYNVLLFERLNRTLYITEAGKNLLNYARHIVYLFDEMEIDLQNSSKNTILNVGATITVGTCIFNKAISEFEKLNPNIKVNIVVDNTSAIEDMILKSQIDLGVVEGEIKSTSIVVTPIIDDELVLVCSNNDKMFEDKTIDIKELNGMPFILREHGSGTRELFEKQLEKSNVKIYEKWICNNSEAIKNAVMEGQGLSVISKRLIQNELNKKELYIIKINNVLLDRKFKLAYHKNKYLSEQINYFIDFLKK